MKLTQHLVQGTTLSDIYLDCFSKHLTDSSKVVGWVNMSVQGIITQIKIPFSLCVYRLGPDLLHSQQLLPPWPDSTFLTSSGTVASFMELLFSQQEL